ncbi:MAG: halocyanin domain-containing protein, partial [Salinirussus sp.]
MHRRDFLRTAGGTAALSAGAGTAAATEAGGGGGGAPDFGGWFDDVPYFDGVTDETGNDAVSVTVGGDANNNLSFLPAAIHVDNGAEVTWEWSGAGGAHNVVHEEGAFESELTGDEGFTFTHTFEEDGIYPYFCEPHRSAGMKGAVVVGTDYPTTGGNGGGGGPAEVNPEHMGVPFQAHFVGMATILAILMSLVFAFYTLKYGESPHTKGGSD